ncbi:hypothetical protein MNBD_GAMMA21-2428 [hydrothermal vent metagenome]|uniref:TNase-like domain-containing protein n=1 Tax=hydrothermal vent metagenome TaxID=652676 RepID=A0A3B1AE64_9ZZZZ
MMNKVSVSFGCIILLISQLELSIAAGTQELLGRVDDVPNGDTIIIIDQNKKRHKVYLLGIDAPELKQPFGIEAKAHLDRLLFARNYQAKVVITRRTAAGNIVGTVYATELNSPQYNNINGMMVMSGFAWANLRTSKQYIGVEKIAQNRKIGLWKQKKPQAPWLWRKGQK